MRPLRGTSILIAIGLFLVFGAVATSVVNAQDLGEDIPIRTEVVIPGSDVEKTVEGFFRGKVGDLAGYLNIVYTFLISIVGVVAGFAVLIGGYQYLTAGGDAGRVQAAKKRIGNAIIGLVLALGSFTLLNTINPALVNLEVPKDITGVETELVVLPWCDQIEETGGDVNPVLGEPDLCGSVGEYEIDGARQACLYRSVCSENDELDSDDGLPRYLDSGGGMQRTCVQTLTASVYSSDPLTSDDVLQFVDQEAKEHKFEEENPNFDIPGGCGSKREGGKYTEAECETYNNWYRENLFPLPNPYEAGEPRPDSLLDYQVESFARCQSCVEYGARGTGSKGENDPPVSVSSARCGYWSRQANDVSFSAGAWEERKKAGKKQVLSYCFFVSDEPACAQSDFACKEPVATSSCGNYNDIKPFIMFDTIDGGYGWWEYGIDKLGTVASRPDALAQICRLNPCGYNAARNGCTGSSGFIDSVRTGAAAVRDGVVGIQECVNKTGNE